MHSNRCLGAKTGAGAQKTFDRDKTSSCHPNWAHPLPTQLINELSLSWIQMALSYWGLWAPIHNTFLMSFDVELPFFATFLPLFCTFFQMQTAEWSALSLWQSFVSFLPFVSRRIRVWGETGKKPIHDPPLPGMKPNKLKSSTLIFYDRSKLP